jgi:hypothetical protein
MVELTEDDLNIYIKISRQVGVDLERVYNKNYFFSLGLHVVENEEKTNKKNGGEKDIGVDTLDKSEKAIDDAASAISKKVEMASEILSENMNFNAPIEFVIAKSEKDSKFQNFTSYLENLKTRSDLNPLTTFSGTGVDYIILENINFLHSSSISRTLESNHCKSSLQNSSSSELESVDGSPLSN